MTEESNEGDAVTIGGEAVPAVTEFAVGRRYRTRDGQVVVIEEDVQEMGDPFAWYGRCVEPDAYAKLGGLLYCADGYLFADPRYRPHPLDLVAEVV